MALATIDFLEKKVEKGIAQTSLLVGDKLGSQFSLHLP